MNRKIRAACLTLAALTVFGTVGCQNRPQTNETATTADSLQSDEPGIETTEINTDGLQNPADRVEVTEMNEIQYEMTGTPQEVGDSVHLRLPSETAQTGIRQTAYLTVDKTLITEQDYNYFIVDWGDGTWSYNGPYVYYQTGEVYHTYKQAGTYEVKACAINLKSGKRYGWTEAQRLTASGEDYTGNMITGVTPIGSSTAGEGYDFVNIVDSNNDTKWQSATSASVKEGDYIGLLFNDYYTLDTLEIKFPSDMDAFPSNITVEYTTDGGDTWYLWPRYYYVLPNSEGYYDCMMKFPNPKGATLVLPLEGIVANGVRFRSVRYNRGERCFGVEEMRVYGEKGSLLYTSNDGYYNADLTNMWTIFGLAATETYPRDSIFRSGEKCMMGSLEWAHWDGIQWNWTGDEAMLKRHASAMIGAVYGGDGWYYDEATGQYVVDESEYADNPRNDGFIWATGGAPKHLDAQNHYTNNSSLIIAARDYILMGNTDVDAFLSAANSRGQVMLDKLRKAMDYMLVTLNGQSGLMTIYDPRNDGTVRGLSSNYWDSLNFFGYNSAYENILFYESVLAMADIEAYLGNAEDAAGYRELAAKIKTTFNDYFWNSEKGRYITSVNVKGDVLDFGLTMVNFMAVAAGLASEEQARLIYDWVDGRRIIEGDNSTGADIYNFKVSARTNTVAVETIEEDGLHYWWYNGHSFNDVLPGHWGVYGQQMQNGGTIFYTSYYDVAGRTILSGDLAMERFNTIMDEFHIDSLRRDPRTKWGYYLVSINGEFPESGLVPATFVTDILGLSPEVEGLKIQSSLPADMTYAGIRAYHYSNRVYHIEVSKTLTEPEMTSDGEIWTVRVPADQTYYVTPQNELLKAP